MDVASLFQYFSLSPSYWSQREIAAWLELLNMGEYKRDFEINKVDGLIIFDLEDREIEDIIGVKNSIHRKRLRNGINILKQFKDELLKIQVRSNKDEDQNDGKSENFPSMSTSVMNAQQAKVFSVKGNHFMHFNSQTAQRGDLENVFNAQALANFDGAMSYQGLQLYSPDQKIEEEKTPTNIAPSEFNAFDNNKNKLKNKFQIPALEHQILSSEPRNMNIEEDEPEPPVRDHSLSRQLRKSQSAADEDFTHPVESSVNPLLCRHPSLKPDEKIEKQRKAVKDLILPGMHNMPTELIIQPIDGAQSNNFYCINENGGRIGRHSDNEIIILEESVSRYHANIEYRDHKFYLIDRGSTTGSFIKIMTQLVLEEDMVVEMGSNQFLVENIIVRDPEHGELHLKVIEGMHLDQKFVIQNNATIGRKGQFGPTTIALIDDLHLSNTHTKFTFADSKFIIEDLGTTNGTWLRMSPEGIKSRPYELYDNLIFKIGASSTFKAKRPNVNNLEMLQSPKNYDGSMNCAVCFENERDVVFVPCSHNVTCLKCSKNLKECPVCMLKITDCIRIYKS